MFWPRARGICSFVLYDKVRQVERGGGRLTWGDTVGWAEGRGGGRNSALRATLS